MRYHEIIKAGVCGKCCKDCELCNGACAETKCTIRTCAKEKMKIPNCSYCNELPDCLNANQGLDYQRVLEVFRPREYLQWLFSYDLSRYINSRELIFCPEHSFFKELYFCHDDEEALNNSMRFQEKDGIIVIGPPGSGKSTYVRKCLWYDRLANYLHINCENHKIDETSLGKDDSKFIFFYHNLIKDAFISEIGEKYESNELVESAYNRIANMPDTKRVALPRRVMRSLLLYISEELTSRGADNVTRKLKSHTGCQEIEKAVEVFPGEDLYSFFETEVDLIDIMVVSSLYFNSKKPFVILFDNLDSLDYRHAFAYVLRSLSGLFDKYRSLINEPQYSDFPKTKYFYLVVVREENMELIHDFCAHTILADLISINDNYVSDHLKPKKKYNINKNTEDKIESFLNGVFDLRFKYLTTTRQMNNSCGNVYFGYFHDIYMRYFMPHETKAFISGIDFFKICNYSLRIYLSTSYSIVDSIVINMIKSHKDVKKLTKETVEPYIWSYLWGKGAKNSITRHFNEVVSSLQNESSCELSRLILTYLHNKKGDNTSVYELISDFQRWHKYDDTIIKDTILKLGKNHNNEFNLIMILYRNNSRQFTDDTLLFLEPRGYFFIEKLLINVDYFIFITHKLGKGIHITPLVDLDIVRAIRAMEEVATLLDKLSGNYMNYLRIIMKDRRFDIVGEEDYKSKFVYGRTNKEFYIKRVTKSHMDSLSKYLINVFQGPDCSLLLTEMKFRKLTTLFKSNYVAMYNATHEDKWKSDYPHNIKNQESFVVSSAYDAITQSIKSDNPGSIELLERIEKVISIYKKINESWEYDRAIQSVLK
jgi:hypothetical protein